MTIYKKKCTIHITTVDNRHKHISIEKDNTLLYVEDEI